MTKPKWIDAGNRAHGFIAFGNLATGFIAIGNVARGFIAIGNLAIGVIAIGNVGAGVIGGAGASVALGLFAIAAALPFGVLDHVGLDHHPLPPLVVSAIPIVAWAVMSLVMRGKRSQRELPPLATLSSLRDRSVARGWILGRIAQVPAPPVRPGGPSGLSVTLDVGRERILVPLTAYAETLYDGVRGREVLAEIEPEERVLQEEAGYREGPTVELALVCKDLRLAPPEPPIWQSPDDITWMLSRVWRGAAILGALAWVVQLVV